MVTFVGSSEVERSRIAVTLSLVSGQQVPGFVFVPPSGRIRDLLNQSESYLDFETQAGGHIFIHKQQVGSVIPFELPRNDQLARKSRDLQLFDPHLTLGVAKSAGQGEIKAAYWGKARLYHPDKMAGLDAPKEVVDYMSAQFVRINEAYRALSGDIAATLT